MTVNFVDWAEIPVSDIDRAVKFYGEIFDEEITRGDEIMGFPFAFLPLQGDGVSGGLTTQRKPSTDGTMVYLNAREHFDAVLGRIEAAGGEIVLPKADIGENGIIAQFKDTEGNIVGLHTMHR